MVLQFEEPASEERGAGDPEDIVGDLDVLELSTDDDVSIQVKNHSIVGKVASDKVVKVGPLRAIVAKAWPAREIVEIHELEVNTFLFVFKDERDKLKVLKQGPWSVMDCHLVLKEWPKEATLEEIDFTSSKIWVQVHGLPLSYLTKANSMKIGSVFQMVIEMDFEQGFNLKRKGAVAKWVSFKYEHLLEFCYQCGRLGHPAEECRFEHDERKKDYYGHWLRAGSASQKLQSSRNSRGQDKLLDWKKSPPVAEVHAIKKIPIGPPGGQDKVVWHHEKSGNYSVRSGYKLLRSSTNSGAMASCSHTNPKVWSCIWRLSSTPRVKSFIWRACHNALATKANLRKKGMQGTSSDPIDVWQKAAWEFDEFSNSNSLEVPRIEASRQPPHWYPPPLGFVKLNCDAAWDSRREVAGIAVICRDPRGRILEGLNALVRAGSAEVA
ncbi:hypothetical protein COLO4_04241 [Corchorus olitorius]|uniref:CCHC-type domain-containing protein n=1 Tax=Corchorus olitorius TaxID=93759 RepID=A0A1R3KUQ8_9ROSI|nr:hypothetical protein COLO4_04241 [Corchorus olitorius]